MRSFVIRDVVSQLVICWTDVASIVHKKIRTRKVIRRRLYVVPVGHGGGDLAYAEVATSSTAENGTKEQRSILWLVGSVDDSGT